MLKRQLGQMYLPDLPREYAPLLYLARDKPQHKDYR